MYICVSILIRLYTHLTTCNHDFVEGVVLILSRDKLFAGYGALNFCAIFDFLGVIRYTFEVGILKDDA